MYKYFSGAEKCVFKDFTGFSSAGEVSDKYIYRNTSPTLQNYVSTLLRAGEAWEVFKNTFPARRSIYTRFSGSHLDSICVRIICSAKKVH